MSLGFIILRHVNSRDTDIYWKKSYESVRKFYKDNKIIIIDDNSNYEFIDSEFEKKLTNCIIVKSEYKGRGELLPYLYFLGIKHCDVCLILHDSCFMNKYIDFKTETFEKLWHFRHKWNQTEDELRILKHLDNNKNLIEFYNNNDNWKGCFGAMALINYNFLEKINQKYDLFKIVDCIKSRYNRKSFERVISILLHFEDDSKKLNGLFGDIHQYCPWGVIYQERNKLQHLPIIKIWSGR